MTKRVISPEEFIAEVNRLLKRHHAFKSNWSVYLVPPGSDGRTATGYEIEPRDAIGHIAQVIDHVLSSYDVNPHISRAAE